MGWNGLGRLLVILGVAIAIVGGLMLLFGRLGLGSLPGDIRVRGEGWGCYVPIVSSILLSLLLTLILNLFFRWFGK
ncbi:MAG: DUF2905 domain-containing protein [Coriobacteriia bacterium]